MAAMRALANLLLLTVVPTLLSGQQPTAEKDENTAVPSDFVRFVKVGDGGHLDTAITTYRNADGVEVTCLGAVHIADPSHYAALQQRFTSFDALLYELVGPNDYRPRPGDQHGSGSFVSMLQTMLKKGLELQFQLDAIDYSPANFVHADMTGAEFADKMEERGESLLGLMWQSMLSNMSQQKQRADSGEAGKATGFDLVSAFRSGEGRHAMRMAFAQQLEDLEAMAFGGKNGSTLVEGRNEKCLEVLQQQIKAGNKKLGIYYGAAHFTHIEKRLTDDLGFHKVKQEWLLAWDCTKRPDPKFDKDEFDRRQLARQELTDIAAAAKLWRLIRDRVPTLADLKQPDADGKVLYGGHTVDPWGHDYSVRSRSTSRLEAVSAGPDGKPGTRDDLVTVEPRRVPDAGGWRQMRADAEQQKALTDAKMIASMARLFRIKNGKMPTLADLCTPDERGHAYIENMEQDPWGHDYVLRETDQPGRVEVVSAGPDGKLGTADDISSSKKP